jgi:hypothetical protein
MNALAKQPFADFTAEQKRYKIILRVTLANINISFPGISASSFSMPSHHPNARRIEYDPDAKGHVPKTGGCLKLELN